jgi:hypothetical protein
VRATKLTFIFSFMKKHKLYQFHVFPEDKFFYYTLLNKLSEIAKMSKRLPNKVKQEEKEKEPH